MMILCVGDSLSPSHLLSLLLSLSPSLSTLRFFFWLRYTSFAASALYMAFFSPFRSVCISEPSSSLVSYGSPFSTLTQLCSGVRFFLYSFLFLKKIIKRGLPLEVFCKNNNSLSIVYKKGGLQRL